MSTNNVRWDPAKGQPEKWSFKGPWIRGQRCIVPAEDYDEPYYATRSSKNIWWRFRRFDGQPWALAGLWNEWTDPEGGEVVLSYTMFTINCDAHPLLKLMHKHDPSMPDHAQDKRSVVPLEREHWDQWLHGSPAEAAQLIKLPALELFSHGAADPAKQVELQIN